MNTALLSILSCLLAAVPTAQSSAEPLPTVQVFIDGKPVDSTSGKINVPASHKTVSFGLGKSAETFGDEARRMRFRLQGIDKDWRQIASEMGLTMRFTDSAGDQVGQHIFRVSGKSSGWSGSLDNSRPTKRREALRVPSGGAYLCVAISSSGPPTAMGIYVVQALKISRSVDGVDQTVFEALVSGADLKSVPEGWARSGTHPSMARLVRGGDAGAFCILDDDPNAHAEWRSLQAIAPAVAPGEQLTVEWSELYDIGLGNRFDVNYGTLGSGTYRFCADELEPTGGFLASAPNIELVVLQPFWKNPSFWFFAAAGLGLLLWLACRSIIRNKIRHHLALAEREHLVERERLRIARDLHDDLGARLTHISLLSGHAENETTIGAAREGLQRISSMSRDLVAALYQTVWTVNPENDHLDALVNFLCQSANNLCEPLGIRCRTHCAEVPTGHRVTSEVRHNVSLAVKEAVHNAVKHGRASEVVLRIEFTDPLLRITVEDNGLGFDPAKIAPGYGLSNMSRRMELIGGRFSIGFANGTQIHFEVPTPATA